MVTLRVPTHLSQGANRMMRREFASRQEGDVMGKQYILNLAKSLMGELGVNDQNFGEGWSPKRQIVLEMIRSKVARMKPETLGKIIWASSAGRNGHDLGFYPTCDDSSPHHSEGAEMTDRRAHVKFYLDRKSSAREHLEVLASMGILAGMCEVRREPPFHLLRENRAA